MTFHKLTVLAAAILIIFNCSPRVDVRGNLPDPDLLANIEIGHITKRGVADLIGSPSSVSPFTSDTWYYVNERTETTAFFAPEIKERNVLVIRFDQAGVVRDVKTFGLEDARKIEIVGRVTPTAGKEFTILRQLFGNIGRFEGGSKK